MISTSIVSLLLLILIFFIFSKLLLVEYRQYSLNGYVKNLREKLDEKTAYPDIDVVYTWVNGSDPVWLKKKTYWSNLGINKSVNDTNKADESSSANRYRDNNELKYSIRSIERYAPWIRNIYLVTDNQIPNWLNLENDRLIMVTHSDIFPNKSHLPVFSSPAIESHLHRIQGISKKFIYFNDDVFLGARVLPDDFFALDDSHKLRFAWEVPKCAPGCSDTWIGDGFCDKACNVSECNFDFPDCINGTNARGHSDSRRDQQEEWTCSSGCPTAWLGDRVCDTRCDNKECGWDMGDCGIQKFTSNFPGTDLISYNMFSHFHNATSLAQSPILLILPIKEFNAFYINVSSISNYFPEATVEFISLFQTKFYQDVNSSAINEFVDETLINSVVLIKDRGALLVLLRHDFSIEETYLPIDINIVAELKVTNCSTHCSLLIPESLLEDNSDGKYIARFSFRVRIVKNIFSRIIKESIPASMGQITSYSSQCLPSVQLSSVLSESTHEIMTSPLAYINTNSLDHTNTIDLDTQAVVLKLSETDIFLSEFTDFSDLRVHVTFTFSNGSAAKVSYPLCDSLGFYKDGIMTKFDPKNECSNESIKKLSFSMNDQLNLYRERFFQQEVVGEISQSEYIFVDKYFVLNSNFSLPPQSVIDKLVLKMEENHSNNDTLYVLLPVPVLWLETRPSFIHAITEIIHRNGTSELTISCTSSVFSWGGKNPEFIDSFNLTAQNNTETHETLEMRKLYDSSDSNFDLEGKIDFHAAWSSFFEIMDLDKGHYPQNNHRKLEDTYGASLLFVNRLLNKEYGNDNRKVPAHLPHLIDVDIMEEMQNKWKSLWDETSSHRFRSSKDMQYAFTFYHYMMNRYSSNPPSIKSFLVNEIDTDRDGSIDDNEFRTLAAIVSGKILNPETIKQYKDCAFPLLKTETVTKKEAYGVVEVSYTITAPPTIENIMNCSVITDALNQRMKTSSHFPLAPPTYSIGEEHDVSFEMIYDNASLTLEKLDSIRWRKNKFICINDNIENSTSELDAVLQGFFNALYPLPSSFELPPGTLNPTLYLDEYNLKYRKNDFISHAKKIKSISELYLLEKIFDEKFRILFLILSLVVLSILLFYILVIYIQKGPISTENNSTDNNSTDDNKTSPAASESQETTLSKAKRKMKNI